MTHINSSKELSFTNFYLKFIIDSRKGRRLQPNGKRISEGTVKNYEYSLQLVHLFCEKKNFSLRIRPARKLNKRELLAEKNYWKKFYNRFCDYLYNDCNFYDNYAGQHIKNLKAFFNYLNKELMPGVGDFHKQFYVRKEDISIFPLMPEELGFLIYNMEFDASLDRRMKEVKDFVVFGCTVALRFSDLNSLKMSNVRNINEQHYLSVRSKKTGVDTLIKLPSYAVEITRRYKKLNKRLLPTFNKSNLNKYIKKLFELAGFTYHVMVTRAKRGKTCELKKIHADKKHAFRFCDVATTHTMRRTAITTMLSLGVPEQIVRKISGHSPGSKEFYRYVSWAQSYQDKETEKMFSRLQAKKFEAA